MNEQVLAHKIQSARKAAGLTQQDLCQQAGLSFSTLTKIERGAIKAPSVFTVQSIARQLHISLDALLEHTVVPSSTAPRQYGQTRSGVRFVYFDMNGCLIHFFQSAFTRIAADTGTPADVIELAFWHYNDDACRGILTPGDFNQKFAQRIGVERIDWHEYYLDIVEPIQPMQALLRWVRERYHVGLLTNTMPGLVRALRERGKLPDIPFDAIIDSSEVAAIKPEAKIYEIAQQRAGVPADQILLIDDSRVNLMAAERQGWHTLWFDDSQSEDAVERFREALQPA